VRTHDSKKEDESRIMRLIKKDRLGKDAARIGIVTKEYAGKVCVKTPGGGKKDR